jgi:ABC-type molybdate transport system substrate-binding protein
MAAATPVWVVVVIVVAAGVGGLGFYAGYEYRGSPASSPSAIINSTLSLQAAGTLNVVLPQLASELVNQTPGISAPAAAQTYQGSLDVTTAITSLAAKVDVAALADFRLPPSLLEPRYASYEVVFASTPEALVYNASIPAFQGINVTNWGTTLATTVATPGVPKFGVWNASTDPNGYNEIFTMMLQGMIYGGGDISAVYGHFYSGAPGQYATPSPATTVIEKEAQAASLLRTGVVSAVITYRSYAIENHLSYVALNPIVGLFANNTTALHDYAELSTKVISSSGGLGTVVPAPILFAATVPLDAPNPALGAAFLHLLVSPQGGSVLSAGGAFVPIFPAWTDNPKAVPPVLAPDVTVLPSWASGFVA